MRVLFIFSRHSKDSRDSTLTKDLADSFYKLGHDITVVTMNERRNNEATHLANENGYNVLRIKTTNYFNINKFEKIFTILTMPFLLKNGILKYLGREQFDLIITHTPFMASHKIIRPLKKHFNCPAFLLLWDLFPQNAMDLGIIKNKLIARYFKKQEKQNLISFEQIFCTSPGNIKYLSEHYLYLDRSKINFQYNYATVKPKPVINKSELRAQYGYSDDNIILLFGGNMGVPQQLENIIALAQKTQNDTRIKYLFIGSGTELPRIKILVNNMGLDNIQFIDQLPREDYEFVSSMCDIGLVSLDKRFTIPNFPSKTADYFKLGLPILASLDKVAITDYGYFLTNIAKAGRYAEACDIDNLYQELYQLIDNPQLCAELSINGRAFYESELNVDNATHKISKVFSSLR